MIIVSERRMLLRLLCVAIFAMPCFQGTARGLEWPRLNFRSLSEKALDEMREEEKVSEVLDQDAEYRSLFHSIRNPDVNLERFVQPGEELKFHAKWRGLPAGNIRLAAKRVAMLKNRPVFVFELNVESNDFLNTFYPVSTNINSYVDAKNGRSYLMRRRISERNRGYKDRLEFKYDFRMENGLPDSVSKYSIVGESGQEVANMPFPIPGNMQDMVSVIYYLRGLDLKKVGDSCNLLVGGRNKPVIAHLQVTAEEEVAIPALGRFDCLVVEPVSDGTNISGNFIASRGSEKVWLEKHTRIPIQVACEMPKPLGEIVATLVQAENCDLARFAKK